MSKTSEQKVAYRLCHVSDEGKSFIYQPTMPGASSVVEERLVIVNHIFLLNSSLLFCQILGFQNQSRGFQNIFGLCIIIIILGMYKVYKTTTQFNNSQVF